MSTTSTHHCEHAWDLFRQLPSVWGPPEAPHNRVATLWRGVSCDTYDLVPSAFRLEAKLIVDGTWMPVSTLRTNAEQLRAELETVDAFLGVADRSGLPLPEDSQIMRRRLRSQVKRFTPGNMPTLASAIDWPPRELLSLMALAQHHGVPTRLLDWTWNPRIAAYFACVGALAHRRVAGAPENERMAIWGVPPNAFQDDVPDESRFAADDPSLVRVSVPHACNKNLAAQQGVLLTIHNPQLALASEADRRSLGELMNSRAARFRPQILKFTLEVVHVPTLLLLLRLHGIHGATMYPGYDGVVRSLRELEYLPTGEAWLASAACKAAQAAGVIGTPYIRLPAWAPLGS